MARIRSVKPEFWTSEQVMHMSRDARLLFIGLWNFCDDNGIHPASPLTLKALVLPADPLTADQVMAFVDEMIEQGLVEEYEVNGRMFWRVTGWHSHQRIEYPTYRHPIGAAPSDAPGDMSGDANDKGDANGDAGDAGDAGDTKGDRVTRVTYKRLGGKQRQIVLRKLRERDGDACHRCSETSNLSILSLSPSGEESASNINDLRLVCSSCKRALKAGDTKNSARHRLVTNGDAKIFGGDSKTERKGEERKGITNFESSSQDSTGVGADRQRDDDDRLAESKRATAIAELLGASGIEGTAEHAIVRSWAADPRMNRDLLTEAITKARKSNSKQPMPLKYLEATVLTLLEKQAVPPRSPTPQAASAAAPAPRRPQGNEPKGPDESYDAWQARVAAYEQTQRQAMNR